jgi:hypothetical protein
MVDDSERKTTLFLAEAAALLLDHESIHAWKERDPEGLAAASALTLSSLASSGIPQALTLLLSLLHQAIWHFMPSRERDYRVNLDLVDQLADGCISCVETMARRDFIRHSENGEALAIMLVSTVAGAVTWLKQYGHRSATTRMLRDRFPTEIVLVSDADGNRNLMRGLGTFSSVYWFESLLNEVDYTTLPTDFRPVRDALQSQMTDFVMSGRMSGGL